MVINHQNKIKIPVTELEQSAFCQDGSNFRTKTLEQEFKAGVRWQKIPTRYLKLKPEEIKSSISELKKALGEKVVILGHHYQREDVIEFSDLQGDSFLLSKLAAETKDAEVIIFCGVHFMAETAEILSSNKQKVILPNMAAGCSMADMASTEEVQRCWKELSDIFDSDSDKQPVIPVTYMNSTASIKSLCGQNNGIVCTSSNAKQAFDWAYDRGERILFVPDQHLGRNTAKDYGIKESEMVIWDPYKKNGGLSVDEIINSKIILWKGHCSVHTRFSVKQIENAKIKNPDVNILVHPECTNEVVSKADYVGSTEYIKNIVHQAKPGTSWAIGTEINLVKRLSHTYTDKNIFCLDEMVCPCATMYRVHPAYLLWVLEGLVAGFVINQISVDDNDQKFSKLSLQRMLDLPK
ncbi:MAG: quinolinate synthase [Chloroflexi bacterium]|nr:quinolinate synthase [Chloroflexota bacterium]